MPELLDFQVQHAQVIADALLSGGRALDASDTGTGKTYVATVVCSTLDARPFVICPKSVIPAWKKVLSEFGVRPLGISNYETLHNCMYFDDHGVKTNCPWLKRVSSNNNRDHPSNTKTGYTYEWRDLPDNAILIFDEAHRCKNHRTLNSVLLYSASVTNVRILLASATIADTMSNFKVAGFVLKIYPAMSHAMNWMLHAEKSNSGVPMAGVHASLFGKGIASRMRIKDLGGHFPSNQVVAQSYEMDCQQEIEEQYHLIEMEVQRLKDKEELSGSGLARIMFARMRIEQLKIPCILEIARQYLDEGNAVAIFVNFNNTLQVISEQLNTRCTISGDNTGVERQANIDAFQSDASHVIVCNIRSGGVGVSLHDTHGQFPRVSIISPSWSAQDMLQALGRTHRAGGLTPVRQRIIFCANTIEDSIATILMEKINNISALNDGDLNNSLANVMSNNESESETPTRDQENRTQRKFLLEARMLRLQKEIAETQQELDEL